MAGVEETDPLRQALLEIYASIVLALIKAQLALAVADAHRSRRAPERFTIADLLAILERFEPRFRSDGSNWSAEDNTDPQ
jgi:hypothetical protein